MYAWINEAQHPAVLQWGLLKVSQGIMHFLLGNSLYKKSPLSKVTARSLQAKLCSVMLCLVMIKSCNFQPTSFGKSSDNLITGFLCLKTACGQVFGNGQTTLKTLEERARLQELGQARPPRALSLSKHQLSYHLGEGNHFCASFRIQNA